MERAVKRNKFFLFRVCRVCARLGFFLVAREGDQSNLAQTLSGKIGDVQVVVMVGGDGISCRMEHRWEPEKCEDGREEEDGGGDAL